MSYMHTASDGTRTMVTVARDGERSYFHEGRTMVLPAIPNRDHGRYFAQVIANGVTLRREYRQLHDDWMLPTPLGVQQFDNRHAVRREWETNGGDPYRSMGERRLERYLRSGI